MRVSSERLPVAESVAEAVRHPWVLLIVDSERSARARLRKIAEQAGFKVVVTEDPRKIIGLIETYGADALVLDLGLSGADGLETLAVVGRKYPKIQVIACSPEPSVESVLTAIKAGACDYLQKPLYSQEMASLMDRLQDRLERSREDGASRQSGQIHVMARRNWIIPLAELEREAILSTLQQLSGNIKLAAKLLGVGKTTLYRKMKEYGLTRGQTRNRRTARIG